uniref:Uncharacterized protein n=1 Tax=Fagus sylvatica TaxID=28930 RepID=A0A2N9I397_FAGSY
MLSANREFHVVAWSHYLSNTPGLADQLVASRKDSAREGGCPGGKMRLRAKAAVREKNAFYSQRVFSQILSQFARIFDLAPDVRFRRSWYRWKACAAYFCKVPDLRKSELGLARYGPANGGHRSVFGPLVDQLVASQEDSARKRGNVGGKILEFSARPYFVDLFSHVWPCTEASLGSPDMILRTEVVGMFLMLRGHLLTEIPA